MAKCNQLTLLPFRGGVKQTSGV